jgi:uncharacterized protein YciI
MTENRSKALTTFCRLSAALLLLLNSAIGLVRAQQKPPEFNLSKFHMVMLNIGPKWKGTGQGQLAGGGHASYVKGLLEDGTAVLAGAVEGDGPLRGIVVLTTESAEEAKKIAESDPAVKSGVLTAEVHPWFAEKGIMKPVPQTEHSTYYFGLLRRGPKWTPERTPETEKIQAGHMANIQKMADLGKLVIAGPFGDDGQLRGVFFFKTESADEAENLAAADAAIQAGRLVLELHPLKVAKGSLP